MSSKNEMHNEARSVNGAKVAAIACKAICRHYRQGTARLEVLRGIDLDVARGERIAIVGASGSGKSTLLGLLGLLDKPDSGELLVMGNDPALLNDSQASALRNAALGFVYQFHHLLPEFTALENVAMPKLIAGKSTVEAQENALQWLQRVGLQDRAGHRPSELSGGERQRVAIARALVNEPACVLMDEPTGNLDRASAANVLSLIDALSGRGSTAFIVVTHDPSVASVMDRVYELRDGRLHHSSSDASGLQLAGAGARAMDTAAGEPQ